MNTDDNDPIESALHLPQEFKQKLKEQAASLGLSFSDYVCQAFGRTWRGWW
jgi:hypothetical protein